MECSTPSGPMKSTPVARLPSVRIRDTNVSGRSSALPLSSAFCNMATGSPLAWMGQPKYAQNPQLLHASRPSYGSELVAPGAGYGWNPRETAAADDSFEPYMDGPGGIGYGPDRHAAKGLAPASPDTPIRPSTSA